METGGSSDDDLPSVTDFLHRPTYKGCQVITDDITVIKDDDDGMEDSEQKVTEAVVLSDSDESVSRKPFTSWEAAAKGRLRQQASVRSDFYSDGSDSDQESVPLSSFGSLDRWGQRESVLAGVNLTGQDSADVNCADDNSTDGTHGVEQHWNVSSSNQGTDSIRNVTASPGVKRKRRTPEEIAASKLLAEEKKKAREEEKIKKQQEREEKAKEKEIEAARRRALQQARKAARPGECTKHLTIMMDSELVRLPCGARLLGLIQERGYRYDIHQQPHPYLVTFWREVTEVKESQDKKLETITREVVEDQLIALLPLQEFVQLVYQQHKLKCGVGASGSPTLRSYIDVVRGRLEDRHVTLLVQGMEKYHRDQHSRGQSKKAKRHTEPLEDCQHVSRLQVEEALVDVQLHTGCNIRFTETDNESASTILQYAKAVAEAPFKRDRLNVAFNLHIESSSSVKIDKEGHGVVAAWRAIIQQFKGIGAEVANAIMAVYPTPRHLYQAYEMCSSETQASRLLEDIVVRRGYGVMETNRRVGKELSKKMHTLFTSLDPGVVIK